MLPALTIGSTCISCDNCALVCPDNAVISNGETYVIDTFSCTLCQLCIEVCPVDCIKLVNNN